jgi:hypothetical protein
MVKVAVLPFISKVSMYTRKALAEKALEAMPILTIIQSQERDGIVQIESWTLLDMWWEGDDRVIRLPRQKARTKSSPFWRAPGSVVCLLLVLFFVRRYWKMKLNEVYLISTARDLTFILTCNLRCSTSGV